MYPYSKSVAPAVRTHLDAQTAFLTDIAKSIFNSFQKMSNLNLQLIQAMVEETALTSQQMLTVDQPTDVIGAVAARAQPVADKLRAYQQHLSRLAAEVQVDMSRVAEEHVQETAQTAKALAEEVSRVAVEDTERNVKKQEESIREFTDPFTKNGGKRGNNNAAQGSASMHSGASGNAQGGATGGNHSAGKPT